MYTSTYQRNKLATSLSIRYTFATDFFGLFIVLIQYFWQDSFYSTLFPQVGKVTQMVLARQEQIDSQTRENRLRLDTRFYCYNYYDKGLGMILGFNIHILRTI